MGSTTVPCLALHWRANPSWEIAENGQQSHSDSGLDHGPRLSQRPAKLRAGFVQVGSFLFSGRGVWCRLSTAVLVGVTCSVTEARDQQRIARVA